MVVSVVIVAFAVILGFVVHFAVAAVFMLLLSVLMLLLLLLVLLLMLSIIDGVHAAVVLLHCLCNMYGKSLRCQCFVTERFQNVCSKKQK